MCSRLVRRRRASQFNQPTSLDELLTWPRLDQVDIARMNLLCAVGLPGSEHLPVDEYLSTLDAWASHIRAKTNRYFSVFGANPEPFENSEPLWRLLCIVRSFHDDFGVHYREDRKRDFANWRSSGDALIHGLLGPRRWGTCASLPVLFTTIARRLGYPVHLMAIPGHFLCRWDGLDHPNPAWRERHNIDFNGEDLNIHPDDHYYDWPFVWSREMHAIEKQLGSRRLFLRPLRPAEELAAFLAQRGHCLEDWGALDAAWECYVNAFQLARDNWIYQSFAIAVHRKKLAMGLLPYGLTPEQYVWALVNRLQGSPKLLPWEVDIGQPPVAHLRKVPSPRPPTVRMATIRTPLPATEQALVNRLGTSRLAPSHLPSGTWGTQPRRYPGVSFYLDPIGEQCVFTDQSLPNPAGSSALVPVPFENNLVTRKELNDVLP